MAKLELMYVVDWEQAQEVDAALVACHKWLHLRKGMPPSRWDTLHKECLGAEAKTEQGKMFFHIHNSLVLNKGLMYAAWCLTEYTGMLAIRDNNGPWPSHKRGSGGP